MAKFAADSLPRNDIELEPATNWALVRAAAILGGIVAAGLAGVVVLAATQTAPPAPVEAVAALRPAPPSRAADYAPVKREAPVEAAPEPAMWKPLAPPLAPPVTFPFAFKPAVRLADLKLSPDRDSAPLPRGNTSAEPAAEFPLLREHEARFASDLQAPVRLLDLDAASGSVAKLLVHTVRASFQDARGVSNAPPNKLRQTFDKSVVEVIARRPDLAGLPVESDADCLAPSASMNSLQEVSRLLRRIQDRGRTADEETLIKFLADKKDWLNDEYVPALAQMLCVEGDPVRLQLTKMLAATRGRLASVALARQVLFDDSVQVRQEAIRALMDRPCLDYRETLVHGLRYPLPAVAERAATALIRVNDQGAVPALEKLAELPDPALPFLNEDKHWVVAEVVKVNHLRNCLLCHAPAGSDRDMVLGFVPKPGQAIPPAYYGEKEGDFVRADVTFLRQDFSRIESVSDTRYWPAQQRFDYLVRQRELTEQEIAEQTVADPWVPHSYPQQEAVRSALEKLSALRPADPHEYWRADRQER